VESPKIDKFRELIQTLPKAIIYYEFTSSLNQIEQVLKEEDKKYVVVNGKCNTKKSTLLIEKFKYHREIYLVIQCRSGNAGLDLTNTNNIIFYSLPESYIVFHQCKARIRRIGQLKDCNYYYLICEDSIEELIYSTLKRKKSFTDKVFQNYLK
jgi:SNF2 family DNA or RNA helicase